MDLAHDLRCGFSLPSHIQGHERYVNQVLFTGHFVHSCLRRVCYVRIFDFYYITWWDCLVPIIIFQSSREETKMSIGHQRDRRHGSDFSCSTLQQQQSRRIGYELMYSRYLKQLRNGNERQPFSIYQKNMAANQHKIGNERSYPSYNMEGYQPEAQQNVKKPQIKWSCEILQDQINDHVLNVSNQVDHCLENGLSFPGGKADGQVSSKQAELVKNSRSSSDNDTEQSIKSALRFANEGVSFCMMGSGLQKQVLKQVLLRNNYSPVPKANKNNEVLKILYSNIGFKKRNEKTLQIFEKTQLMENKSLNSTQKARQPKRSLLLSTKKGKTMNLHASQGDLLDILNKYNGKMQKFGKNSSYMTEKRSQGLFMNEYYKKSRKYGTVDILSHFIDQNSSKEQKKQNIEVQQKQTKKLTTLQLTNHCRHKMTYLNELKLLRL